MWSVYRDTTCYVIGVQRHNMLCDRCIDRDTTCLCDRCIETQHVMWSVYRDPGWRLGSVAGNQTKYVHPMNNILLYVFVIFVSYLYHQMKCSVIMVFICLRLCLGLFDGGHFPPRQCDTLVTFKFDMYVKTPEICCYWNALPWSDDSNKNCYRNVVQWWKATNLLFANNLRQTPG